MTQKVMLSQKKNLTRENKFSDPFLMAKIKLDLHDIFNNSQAIEAELNKVMREAIDKKIALVEIIPGKGSGQLKNMATTWSSP